MGIEAAKSRIAPASRRIEWKHNGNIVGIDRACSEISAVTSSYISQKYLFGETRWSQWIWGDGNSMAGHVGHVSSHHCLTISVSYSCDLCAWWITDSRVNSPEALVECWGRKLACWIEHSAWSRLSVLNFGIRQSRPHWISPRSPLVNGARIRAPWWFNG